ncbi:hypothetical protein GN330_16425 [Nitratireductor sp. CAU 1489]|uniref:Uncharacterized protein n=1 Tax=Nitratireductor arenosus TaxID=2682096 RepID=A0A844QJR2_9HYPH|nr:hypothetical protein [Nitratireductor arenosus]MVA98834.1 hypothetical protein [Nitratireductor arenosus]
MTLVANWRRVLRHAWSVRLMLLAALLSGAEIALPLLQGVLPVPPLTFAALSGLTTAAALIARFIAQDTVGEE